MVDDGIKSSQRPRQLLDWWRVMSVRNFIQSSLSDVQHQCVEGIREQNCWLLLQVDYTHGSNRIRTTRHLLLPKNCSI